jgi:hypothetical protein
MEYSLSAISTIEDCDALLQVAEKDQRALGFKKTQQTWLYENTSEDSSEVDAQLAATIAEITGLEGAVTVLPEGDAKRKMLDNLVDLRHRQFQLEKRRRQFGTLAMIQKQYAITGIEKLLAENASYIDAVKQRKAELPIP